MSSGTEAIDRKQRIRDRYRGVDTSELEVIPAKIVEGLGESTSIRRVAAYVRVSTDNDEQTSSYELQKNYYTDYIKAQLICTPNTGHPVLGVFLCDTVMNTRRCASNYIDKENGSRHQKE